MKKINGQQKEVKFESENNNKLLQISLDAMNEAIFVIDLDHKILQCNKATLDILGKSNYHEIIGHSCRELVHGTTEPVELCPVRRMWETGHRETDVQLLNGRWIEISAEPVYNDEGEISGAVHIITDINARKKAEDALKESKEQYLMILNSLSDAMHVVDKDLRIVFQNPAMNQWLDLLNLYPNNVGKTVFEAFPFLEHDKVYYEYIKVFKDKEPLITIEATKLPNRVIFTETLKIPIISEGQVNQVITILRDKSEQKRAEQKVKDSEEKFRAITEQSFMSIIVLQDGLIKYVNDRVPQINGYSREEIENWAPYEFLKVIHPEDKEFVLEQVKKKQAGDKDIVPQYRYRLIRKDNEIRWVENFSKTINYQGGLADLVMSIDITDKIQAEHKLKESEEKYRLITENINDMIAILNSKIEYEYVNEAAFQNIMGRPKDILIGGNALRWVHPDDLNKCLNAFKQGWEKGESSVQARFKDVNNKYHWLDVRGKKIFDRKGEDKVLIVSRDISERKSYEQELRVSEEKYRYLIENALEGVWVIDSNADTTLVNPSMANILGYSIDEMIGKSVLSFMDDNQAKITKMHLEKRKKGISEERDAVFIHKNGNLVYLRIRATPIFNNEGKYEGTYAFLTDITQRKLAEQKLKESEEKFRNIFEAIPMGMFLYEYTHDGDLIFRESNPASDRILNFDTSQFIDKTIEEAFPPLIETDIPERYRILAKEGGTWKWDQVNYQYGKIQGAYEVVAFQTSPGFMVTSFNNIDEKIEGEIKLKESEEKFRTIAEQSFMGIIILQEGLFKYFNEQAVKMNGYTIEEIQNWKPYEFSKIIYPEDREFVMGQARKKQLGDPDVVSHYRYRVIKKNGEVIWVENFSKTINYGGKPADFVMTIDISDKIKAEQKLKESEEKYRLISENTDDLIVVYNEDGSIEYLNAETHSKVLGYNSDKFFEKSFRDALVHEDDRKMTDLYGSEGLNKGNFQYQFRLKHKNGEYLWFEVSGKKFLDNNGNTKILCVTRNIDEKRGAEEKIKESEENFRTIAEQAFIGTLIIQDDNVEYINNALLQIFEYSHEEVDRWNKDDLIKLIYPEDLQYLRDYRKRLRNGELDIKPYYTYRVFTKYGKIKWIDQFSRPILYRGKPAELVTIMDITEKKKAEDELIKLNKLKSELLRRTSHELKTPLVSIKGFSDLLLTVHKEKLDDYVLATIREIKLGCERLESLIQDILKTSELESESVELKKSQEDLSFLIKLCVRELQGLTRLRNHEIKLNIHDRLITKFEPDQVHLVISNLLNNAIKYTPPNGKIEIKSAITDYFIIVSIQDNGIGITNEEKKRLFSQFGKIERYGQGLDIISDGSGLGLFITKKIIELHGGRIWVRSKGRNKGSTFFFSLPLLT